MTRFAGAEVRQIPLRRRGPTWRLPVALVALGLIPVLAGSARLAELAGGPELLPPRFDPSPVPLVVHIVGVIIFAVLGAFQFSVDRGRPRSAWHHAAGHLLVVVGMVVALSALWLTLFHPRTEGGDLLFLFRLLAGTGMFASLLLGSMAIRRRDIAPPSCRVRAGAINLAVAEWFIRRGPARRSAHAIAAPR